MKPEPRTYPDRLEVRPLERPPRATVRVPGSKSITNRALVLAALLRGGINCTLRGCLCSEDTEVMIDGLRRLGIAVRADWASPEQIVTVVTDELCGTIPARATA